ncbi:unnamed protein product [Cuscuta campestris]|uniref:Integrase catalytic domain-containing protein n=1 Tax=Cuscuta campestris TaxID=132261 RepID=A0A484MXB8_9ASTE|nr:unnamed protein product [Cuscuta campestris]
MASSDNNYVLTLEDVMSAINDIRKELHATKVRVTELSATRTEDQRHPGRPPHQGWRPPPSRMTTGTTDPIPRMRVDAPRFNGEDPTGWIFRIQKYFDYFMTPEYERLSLAAMLIDHPASEWFHYYQANNCGATWDDFLPAVHQRFDPSYYENYVGLLSKLTQTGSVMEYQSSFEALLNKVTGVPEATLVAMYVAGLKQPIQREVNLRGPTTLPATFALAREVSACHQESVASLPRRTWSTRFSPGQSSSPASAGLLPTPTTAARPSPFPARSSDKATNPPLPVVRLLAVEKAERTRSGFRGTIVNTVFSSSWVPKTMRKNLYRLTLPHWRERLLLLPPIFQVSILSPAALVPGLSNWRGLSTILQCKCSSTVVVLTPLLLQGHLFPVDLYLLEVHGSDVVLGIQWLQTLGCVSHDYGRMTMEFLWQGQTVTLRGDLPGPKPISYGHLCSLASTAEKVEFYEIIAAPSSPPPDPATATLLPKDLPPIIQEENDTLPDLKDRHAAVVNGTAPPDISSNSGILYYKRRLYISPSSPLRNQILHEFHGTPVAGHQGVDRTFRRIADVFYWPGLRREVRAFVASCPACQATKYSTRKPAGLLQPLPIPEQVWDSASMDFVTGLPPSRGFSAIMVVVDRLSKYTHFGPLAAGFDAPKATQLFVDIVVKHHGFPGDIISDRDPIFLSLFWRELLRLSGSSLKYSTAYHPQTDGQTEVVNRTLEQYLRAFTNERPARWAALLPWAELALNCSHHEGIGMSPFQALYGRTPPTIFATMPVNSRVASVEDMLKERAALLEDLKLHLSKMQQRMRSRANQHRREVSYSVGDLVLLKLQPYRQHSVARPLSTKLSRRFYGPFKVIEQRDQPIPTSALPAAFFKRRPVSVPTAVLDRRSVLVDGVAQEQWLVRWSDGTDTDATWEPASALQQHYPDLRLEDKAISVGGGVDTVHEEDREPSGDPATVRPRRNVGPPRRYRDYV